MVQENSAMGEFFSPFAEGPVIDGSEAVDIMSYLNPEAKNENESNEIKPVESFAFADTAKDSMLNIEEMDDEFEPYFDNVEMPSAFAEETSSEPSIIPLMSEHTETGSLELEEVATEDVDILEPLTTSVDSQHDSNTKETMYAANPTDPNTLRRVFDDTLPPSNLDSTIYDLSEQITDARKRLTSMEIELKHSQGNNKNILDKINVEQRELDKNSHDLRNKVIRLLQVELEDTQNSIREISSQLTTEDKKSQLYNQKLQELLQAKGRIDALYTSIQSQGSDLVSSLVNSDEYND